MTSSAVGLSRVVRKVTEAEHSCYEQSSHDEKRHTNNVVLIYRICRRYYYAKDALWDIFLGSLQAEVNFPI